MRTLYTPQMWIEPLFLQCNKFLNFFKKKKKQIAHISFTQLQIFLHIVTDNVQNHSFGYFPMTEMPEISLSTELLSFAIVNVDIRNRPFLWNL